MEPCGGAGKQLAPRICTNYAKSGEQGRSLHMHFCGAKVRLAKTAQYIAVFWLRAVALYLPAPRTVDRKIEAPASNSLGSRGTHE